MKIRTDYVTNSSSSSFIVAYKECDYINKAEDFLKRSNFYMEEAQELADLEEYENYVYDYIDGGAGARRIVNDIKHYLENGYKVVIKEIDLGSDERDEIEEYVSKAFVIIFEVY